MSGKSSDGNDHHFHLFVRPKDAKAESWEGTRSGLDAATDVFNADEVSLDSDKGFRGLIYRIDRRYRPATSPASAPDLRSIRDIL